MTYFVLAYHRKRGELVLGPEPYEEDRRVEAMKRRFQLEAVYRGDPEMEIVVLGADSEETIRSTHGRYFYTPVELFERIRTAAGAS